MKTSRLSGCGVPGSASSMQIFFLSLHVTARSWSTPILCNCWYLKDSSNCVLLYFSSAGLDQSSLFSLPPCLYFNIALSRKELQGYGNIHLTPNCAGKTQCHCAAACDRPFIWSASKNQLYENMNARRLSQMTQDREGCCSASCCVEWAERQSEWVLSSSQRDKQTSHMEQASQDIYARYWGMSGMWTWQVTSLYLQKRLADSCLLLLLPRSPQSVFAYQRNVCGPIKDEHCLKFPEIYVQGNRNHVFKVLNMRRLCVCKKRVRELSLRICIRLFTRNNSFSFIMF